MRGKAPDRDYFETLTKRVDDLAADVERIQNASRPTAPMYDSAGFPDDPIEGQYAVTVDDRFFIYTNGSWHEIGGSSGGTLEWAHYRSSTAPVFHFDSGYFYSFSPEMHWTKVVGTTNFGIDTTHATGGQAAPLYNGVGPFDVTVTYEFSVASPHSFPIMLHCEDFAYYTSAWHQHFGNLLGYDNSPGKNQTFSDSTVNSDFNYSAVTWRGILGIDHPVRDKTTFEPQIWINEPTSLTGLTSQAISMMVYKLVA
jgi:hypothetical protein